MRGYIFLACTLSILVACTVSPTPSPTAQATAADTRTPVPTTAGPTPGLSPTTPAGPTPALSPTTPASILQATASPAPVQSEDGPTSNVRYGGRLNLAGRENIPHQDVHQALTPALSTWGPGIVYSRLLRLKTGPEVVLPSLAVECELCESWCLEGDKTFVFRLREDVRWQDLPPLDGRGLTSEDIAFSYTRQRSSGWPNAPVLQAIETMETPRSDTLRVVLAFPDADFIIALADGHSKIVAREAVEVNGDLKNGPTVGSGPWLLTATQRGVAHSFTRNPSYFEQALPYVDALEMHIITDAATRDAAFKVRITDVHQLEPDEWDRFQQQQPGALHLTAREAGTGLEVALKTSAPPFDDTRVRRAVLGAIDPWEAIRDQWSGFGYVSLGIPAMDSDWGLPKDELERFFGQPQLAHELLVESDAESAVPVTIKVGDFGQPYLAHAQRIAKEMRAVGFEPTLEIVNRRVFGEDVWLGGGYRMFIGPPASITTPNGYMLSVLHSDGRWNTTEHRDDELDRLIEAQSQEYDVGRRREMVLQIQRKVLEGAYRFMPATRTSIWVWWPRVQGFHPNFAAFEYSHWSKVWLTE